ncbi:DNA repair protein UVH3 [Daucus carota subsp. sativus]|uniref:DNA repair protein UVH3 n=1 Tax=Daucus carota subsp. sativus TaxID=79200 RepID=UPI0030831F6E
MGVHNLWELLSPVGRRVNVETLAGKKLAIDASIWMVQFMKAMRDEKGEMVKNAHILGFFRRICKLLFLRVKPVFVFDGATPVLKRRTVAARRRQRENAQTNIRKTAEKLLINHMKTHRLQQLAENLKDQRQQNNAKGKRKSKDKEQKAADTSEGKKPVSGSSNQEVIDEMLAASLAAEEDGSQMHHASTSVSDAKGKRKITDIALEGKEPVSGSYNQEAIDKMLAASLAAEEDGRQTDHASTSVASVPFEEEDDEAEEEMILPTMNGQMDPAVLAALPPSMQLDLLAQMRERLMAENRQKYQKVKKVPERFSELQIQSYLKTVAFRRDIDEVRKSAAGKGIGGVQTSRIASEPNREFVYSSSFTGDKQVVASAGLDQNSREQQQMPVAPSNTSDGSVPTKKFSVSGSVADQSSAINHNDVETYLDDRGHVRVSRVRAMGLRMTRDLQRNLDLMKESEVESLNTAINTSSAAVSEELSSKMQPLESLDLGDDEIAVHPRSEEFINSRTPLEVTFDVDGENRDDDDDLFTRLVAGDSDLGVSSDEEIKTKKCSDSDSDCEWEEGVILDKNNIHHEVEVGEYPSTMHNRKCHEINLQLEEGLLDGQICASSCLSNYKESDMEADAGNDVEWEDGSSDIPGHTFSCQPIYKEVVYKGDMEEEINFQEAIKRSLEDLGHEKHINDSPEDKEHIEGQEVDIEGMPDGSNNHIKHLLMPKVSAESVIQTVGSNVCGGAQKLNNVCEFDIPNTYDRPLIQSEFCTDVDLDGAAPLIDRSGDSTQTIQPDIGQNGSGSSKSYAQSKCVKSGTPTENEGGHVVESKVLQNVRETLPSFGSPCQIGQVQPGNIGTPGITSDSVSPDVCLSIGDAQQFDLKNPAMEHLTGAGVFTKSFVRESIRNDTVQSFAEGDDDVNNCTENSVMMDSLKEQVEKTRVNLEEEMQRLRKERLFLGVEKRKLERNAEAVSSEMFTECQELLQMFGLPYIIAPMEAEAQCAFMELENLVDGVVTDDSDVLLFGARSVYKNIFDDRKYVETYLMKDIENELGLNREKLIRMALLLGSDYTEGVSGIGIVNAIEVINAFPEENGLHQFREWVESPDPTILGKAEVFSKNSLNCSSEGAVHGPVDDLLEKKQHFINKHRKVSKNWHFPFTFPSQAVISAYNSPKVDKSKETFSWGKPDHFVLRKLCLEKFGWGTEKSDDVLVPVLNEYNKHETQLRLEAFYSFNERFAKIRSRRVKEAVKLSRGDKASGLMDDTKLGNPKGSKRRKLSSGRAGPGEDVSISDGLAAGQESKSNEAATAGCSRKKKVHGEPCTPEEKNSESLMQAVGRENTNGRSKLGCRGRSRGRGKGRSGKRGRGKESSTFDCAEISSSDKLDKDQPDEKHDRSHQVRRSTRPRKAVRYVMNDSDGEELADAGQDGGSTVDVGRVDHANRDMGTAYNASASKLKHHVLVKPSSDNIQSGSGFCPDEAELDIGTDHVNLDQNGTHLNADEDYLKTGGGFCFVADDVDNDTDTHFKADEDCLKTGGGFCFVADDVDNDTDTHFNADEDCLRTGGGFCFKDDDVENDTCMHSNADGDYLKTGGGFCFEDDDVDNDQEKSAYSPAGDVFHSNDTGKSATGGGFCFEDDDLDNDKEKSACSPARDVFHVDTETSAYSPTRTILHDYDNPSNCSVSHSRSVDEIQAGDYTDKPYDMPDSGNIDVTKERNKKHVNVAGSSNIVVGDDPGARSGQFLSAMPNLRRKRKS